MIHNIPRHPQGVLRKKSLPVPVETIKTAKFQKLIDDMIETMHERNGVGLAAPQINISEQIFTLNDGEGSDDQVFINPKIVGRSLRKIWFEEGCLSIPGVYGMVRRHTSVTISALDRNAKPVKIKARGLLAMIFQHETDHLNGALIIDKIKKYTVRPM